MREAAGAVWPAYTRHDFVLALARGDLPEAAFRRYLVQDYLFLLHFARAWGLAVYKSETLAEMRRAHALVAATLDVEIGLHIDYCRGWGLSEAAMAAEPEALETIAYTRFVLDRGPRRRPARPRSGAGAVRRRLCRDRHRADGRPGDPA